jgi:transposase-like protein
MDNQMKAKRQRHQGAFKAKVGLETLVGVKTVSEIAREYQVHPTQVSQWKRAIVDRLPEVFGHGATAQAVAALVSRQHAPQSVLLSGAKQAKIEGLAAGLTTLKVKINRINDAFANGALDIAEFKELKNPVVPRKAELEQELVALEKSRANRLEPLKNWVLEANQAEKWASEDNWLEMKSFLQKVGSNRLLRSQTLTVAFKKPACLLAETNLAVRCTTDVSAQSSIWWRRRELNRVDSVRNFAR